MHAVGRPCSSRNRDDDDDSDDDDVDASAGRMCQSLAKTLSLPVYSLTNDREDGGSDIPIHVSLSKSVMLRYHHIDPIVQQLEHALTTVYR